jgi:hypothetical protein
MVMESHAERLAVVASELERRALRYESERDSRCVFTYAYSLLTRKLATELPGAGASDKEWVVALAEAFASRYFDALDLYDSGRAPPLAWGDVFTRLKTTRSSVLEDLVSAMAAHLVQDLPLALCDVGMRTPQGASRIRDFHSVNDILGHATEEVQDKISKRYNPYLRWLDYLGGNYDEVLTNYGFRLTRAVAWYNAVRLQDRPSHKETSEAIARSPKVFLDSLLNPPIWSLRLISRLARRIVSFGRRWPRTA